VFRVISYLLAAAIFTTPWFIGGNWPFSRSLLVGLGAIGLSAIFISRLRGVKPSESWEKRPEIGFPVVWLFLVAGCLFTAFQASSSSNWLQEKFGAANPAISIHQTTESSVLPTEISTRSTNRPVSVYPAATREKLVDLILAVSVFFIATIVLTRPERLMPVLIALAASGVAISFVGILQRLSYNGKVLWQYELVGGGAPFGSFVNSNNAAGFMLIGFSATMFFVSYKLNIWKSKHEPDNLSLDGGGWESDGQSITSRLTGYVAKMESRHLYFLSALAIIVTGVFTSFSRGGMVALVCSGMVGCFLIARTNRIAGILLTLAIVAGGFGLVGFADQSSGIANQLDSLSDLSTAAGPRVQHWRDAIPFVKNNWLLGCGNGTYRVVSPSFSSFFSTRTFAHAESIYVETLVEMGIGGLLLLIAVLGCCAVATIKLLRRNHTFDRALGIAGIICLIGQVLAAALDFGVYQPANAISMATLMGGIVGRAAVAPSKAATEQQDVIASKAPKYRYASLGLLLLASPGRRQCEFLFG